MNGTKWLAAPLLLLLMAISVGCDAVGGTGFDRDRDPENLEARYTWVLQRWTDGRSIGYPMVQLTWEVPFDFDEEAFRVYGRNARAGRYQLIATVTSCIEGFCQYGDVNVLPGESYDYYVATVDEWDGNEIGSSRTVSITIPTTSNVAAPTALSAVSLDGAAYVEWSATGAQRYMVLSQAENEGVFLIGETDGTSFLDDRAVNGTRYRYYLAAVDEDGQVSGLSTAAEAFPRPDFHSEIIYAHADLPTASGFRFVTSDDADPILAGTATGAQWRVETTSTGLVIQPLGSTAITSGTFTTQLTCGPGAEASCEDIRTAPSDAQFATSPVPVESGYTYVFRVTGAENRVHYAKVRVQGTAVDTQGHRLVVFDWAYQLRPQERSLTIDAP